MLNSKSPIEKQKPATAKLMAKPKPKAAKFTRYQMFVVGLLTLIFAGVGASEVPVGALNTAVPRDEDKGAYLSLCSTLQMVANGFGAMVAGFIIVQATPESPLQNFDIVCYIVAAISVGAVLLITPISNIVRRNGERHI